VLRDCRIWFFGRGRFTLIDFLYSSTANRTPTLLRALSRHRDDQTLPHGEWSGPWGSLVTLGPAYPGFEPVETDSGILVVLGGPLPREDYTIACGDSLDDGSRWILERWVVDQSIKWDDDLVGHFLVCWVDKLTGSVKVVTDFNSFVQGYIAAGGPDAAWMVGSHVDAVAMAMGLDGRLDTVSVAEFLVHGVVSTPHTMYRGIEQLAAASESAVSSDGRVQVEAYWSWNEEPPMLSYRQSARRLRETVQENVERICASQSQINLQMSGGEDSRVVAALIPDEVATHGRTYADAYNREVRLARRVALINGMEWQYVPRSPAHYANHAANSLWLTESHNTVLHAHLSGLSGCLVPGIRCIGGLWADAIVKALFVRTATVMGTATKIDERQPTDVWFGFEWDPDVFGDGELRAAVDARRQERRRNLMMVRPSTWAEYSAFLPAAMTQGYSQVPVARRLCFAYEPYLDARVFRLGASLPQRWKINRRVFHSAMKPLLRSTWYLRHPNGTLPYFGLWVNVPLMLAQQLADKLRSVVGKLVGPSDVAINEGPWPGWDALIASEEFEQLLDTARRTADSLGQWPELSDIGDRIMTEKGCRVGWRFAYLQVLLWAGKLETRQLADEDLVRIPLTEGFDAAILNGAAEPGA